MSYDFINQLNYLDEDSFDESSFSMASASIVPFLCSTWINFFKCLKRNISSRSNIQRTFLSYSRLFWFNFKYCSCNWAISLIFTVSTLSKTPGRILMGLNRPVSLGVFGVTLLVAETKSIEEKMNFFNLRQKLID